MALALKKIEAVQGWERREPLENGTYDAVLSAVIDLEHQVNDYVKDDPKIEHHVKLLFEVPEYTETIEGVELPVILSREVNLSSGEKSKFFEFINAIMKSKVSQDEVLDIINNDGAIKDLLGKALVIQVEQYDTKQTDDKGNVVKRNKIKGFSTLRANKPQPKAVREPFVFEVANPDIEIFTNKLSRWTRDKLMTANNNDEFPPELHKAYRSIKEQEANAKKSGD